MKLFLTLLVAFPIFRVQSQEIPVNVQQQMEEQSERSSSLEDDTWLQQMEQFARHKLNLNKADAVDLRRLGLLNEMQISSFIHYRQLMGEFVSIYELQALPGWSTELVQRLFPFVSVTTMATNKEQLFSRMKKGDYSLIIRSSMQLKRSAGYRSDSSGKIYSGSPQHLFFRVRYQYKDLLQWGISGEKDAGEPFLKGKQQAGFDHYSFHFFLRRMGNIKALALGDFAINLGQGLIHWQSMAFKRSADVMNCKRQSDIIRPYSSSGEFYYNRGGAITIEKKNWNLTGFVSFRKLDANRYEDSLDRSWYVRSFQSSGYHRSLAENEDRGRLGQLFYGGNISFEKNGFRSGVNYVSYSFSLPFRKQEEAYDRYAIEGKHWFNYSADLGYTWKNFHWFAELALDARMNPAILSGLLISLHRKIDLSFLVRNISTAYQTINGNAFTESSLPGNERGVYLGISIKPRTDLRIDCYADIYTYPWLRYRVNAPSSGRDLLMQVNYMPDKQTEVYGRFRLREKEVNQGDDNYYSILSVPQQNFRLHISRQLNQALTLRQRIELVRYDKQGMNEQRGYLFYVDLLYRPALKPFNITARWQYFETGGNDAAVFAYENDVLYSFSIPGLSGKGKRYYLLGGYEINKKTSCWLRLAATIYNEVDHIGEGYDLIQGNKKIDYHFQLRRLF